MNLETIQSSLKELQLPAWLLYDFHGGNPIARHVAGLGEDRFTTRRWFGLIPQTGEPTWLHHAIEAHLFADVPGKKIPFVSYRELTEKLRAAIGNRLHGRQAWEYVRRHCAEANERFPRNTISRMVETVRLLDRPTDVADVQAFFAEHPIEQATKTLEQILERQRVNAEVRARNEHAVIAEFGS